MMDGVIHGFEGIFEIIFMIAIGYILAKKRWFTADSSMLFTKVVMNVSLPLYMIYSLEHNFTHESLMHIAPDLLLPFSSILLAYCVSQVMVRLFRVRPGRRGIFITATFGASTIFVGLPVNLALFGDASVPSSMIYYMANTTTFWTLGVYHIMNDSADRNVKVPFISMATFHKVFSPPLMGFIIGLILLLLNVPMPEFVLTSFHYVGAMTTPLALFVIGIEINSAAASSLYLDKDIMGAIIGRFIISPLCVLALLPIIPVSAMSMKVFLVQSGMPAMTNMTLIAKTAGADVAYSTALCFLTVILGMVFIPVCMLIL